MRFVRFAVLLGTSLALGAFAAPSAAASLGADWPSLGRNAAHTAYAPDPRIDRSVAKSLGVRWMTNLYSADLGSPVVAYSAVLKKMVVYVGDERGDIRAVDEADGSTIWSVLLGPGAALRDTPLVAGGAVWVGTSYGTRLVKLDAATGAILCSIPGPASFFASPMAATIGGTAMVYASTIDEPAFSGPIDGIVASSCSTAFTFLDFVEQTGAWASPAFAVDAKGRNLVVTGSADPDSREYALDAMTGQRYWVYGVYNPPPGTFDIGAAASITAPGVNGFADGVVYVPSKLGVMYALDLTTGKRIWSFNFNATAGVTEGGLSTPAVIGNEIVFGYNGGVFALDATTGASIWQWVDPTGTEVLASPAIVGPPGKEVIAFADLAGGFIVLNLANGKQIYRYQTHGYVSASVAETNGNFIVASSDGYLYDFAPGGGNGGTPATAVAYPASGASLHGHFGSITLRGTAADAVGVKSVTVAVQSGGPYGPWYDAATQTWSTGPVSNNAFIHTSGNAAVTWSLQVPVSAAGGSFQVFANGVDRSNLADVTGVNDSFTVVPAKNAALVTASPSNAPPGGTVAVTASGFKPGESVTFDLAGATMFSSTASSTGSVGPVSLTIPSTSTFGVSPLVATGATSNVTATTSVDVANAWAQYGFGAGRGSFEANDHAFHDVVHIGPGLFITQAWWENTYAAIESSPAIVAGAAYIGNDAGTLSAYATSNGAPIWQYSVPSGAAIRSSPAVDGGLVIFGADDGMLYRVAQNGGAPATPVALGGQLTSPAVAGGTIYIASRGGNLYAVDEASGTLLWSAAGGYDTSTSPAVDVANGTIVVADYSGHVTAYAIGSGTRLWRSFVGGALKSSPIIDDKIVYVGSTNGTFYALSEATGQQSWSYAEGSAIEAMPAIAKGDTFFGFKGDSIFVGADDGTLTALDSVTKKSVWKIKFANAVVGLGATLGDLVFFETADGGLGESRGPEFGDDFWRFQTGGSLDTSPVVLDGALYVGAGDGGLYAFTPFGNAPDALRASGFAKSAAVAPRAAPKTVAILQSTAHAYPIRIAYAPLAAGASAVRAHGGPVQTAPRSYAIFWQPAGSAMDSAYGAAIRSALAGHRPGLAATIVDRSPLPARATDAAFAAEIERAATEAHWPADANAQFILLPARGAFGAVPGFCAYHSAATSGGRTFAYAVVPYPAGADGCGGSVGLAPSGDADADRVLPDILREQLDIASDPLMNARFDGAGREAGDFIGSVR